MLTAHQISKSYGITPVLKHISFSLNAGDRLGLIGPNGAGKTSLIRILAGEEAADSGSVILDPATRIGYLSQGFEPDPDLTLGELIEQATGSSTMLEVRLGELGEQLAADPENNEIQQEYDAVLARLIDHDTAEAPTILAAFDLDDMSAETQVSCRDIARYTSGSFAHGR